MLTAAGRPSRPVRRPAGLSGRECEVLALVARGLATKQVARPARNLPEGDHRPALAMLSAAISAGRCDTLLLAGLGTTSSNPRT